MGPVYIFAVNGNQTCTGGAIGIQATGSQLKTIQDILKQCAKCKATLRVTYAQKGSGGDDDSSTGTNTTSGNNTTPQIQKVNITPISPTGGVIQPVYVQPQPLHLQPIPIPGNPVKDRSRVIDNRRVTDPSRVLGGQIGYIDVPGYTDKPVGVNPAPKHREKDDSKKKNYSNDCDVLDSPVEGNPRISSLFGTTKRPPGGSNPHKGTDYAVKTGTKVIATANGKIVRAGWSDSFGNVIIIDHGKSKTGNGEVYTLYAHGSKLLVSKGEVKAGQEIMLSGETGSGAQGQHLHYEVIIAPKDIFGTDSFYSEIQYRRSPSQLKKYLC